MPVFKTLNEFKSKVERGAPGGSGGSRRFLSLKSGEQFTIRFLNELTLDAKNYDANRGTAELVYVHQNPNDFKIKAACTADEGGCWACEQIPETKRWAPVTHLLLTVAVKDSSGTWAPYIIDTTFGTQKIGGDVLEYASAYGTLTDRTYKYSRIGSGINDTNYSLIPLQESKEPSEVHDFELPDLKSIYRKVEYSAQEEYYTDSTPANPADSW